MPGTNRSITTGNRADSPGRALNKPRPALPGAGTASVACRAALLALVASALVLAGAGCHSAQTATRDTTPVGERLLLPGSPLLTPPPLTDTAVHLVVYLKRGSGDTVEKKMADTRQTQRAIPERRDDILMTVSWDPPYASLDSLVITRRGLVPLTEHLEFRGTFDYRYDKNHVAGTVQPHDSAQRAYDQSFPSNVFAFNEVDLLARSLPFRQGLSVVVPLFSEVDRDLERDTLTVLGPDTSSARRGGDAWVVRFADPVIVNRYVIDRTSREIITSETLPKKSDLRMRYVPS
jgi:hypothetical protein